MTDKLAQDELAQNLQALNSGLDEKWHQSADRLTKVFIFEDFNQALDFMVRAGKHVDELDHHPEWCNVYNRVSIELTTHSATGITELDFALAKRIEQVFAKGASG